MDTIIEWAYRLHRDLKKLETVSSSPVENMEIKEPCSYEETTVPESGWKPFVNHGEWGSKDMHAWFRFDVKLHKLPEENEEVLLYLETMKEGWDAVNPQLLVYVNGAVQQGVDINHREVILHPNDIGCYHIDLHAYAGMRSDERSRLGCTLRYVNRLIRNTCYDVEVLCTICETLSKDHRAYAHCLRILKGSICILQLNEPYSSQFYASLRACSSHIRKHLKALDSDELHAICIGHTHIDVAWQWTVRQTREKAARSFASALELMRRYDDFRFISSQPQLYEFVKEDYPDIYNEIKERVKQGRWECEGGMWLESDCNIPSGESLIRQFLFGKRFFRKEFQVDSKVLWLPDVFGFCASLPQIAKQCGIDYFMTTKLSWNQFNRMPQDTFWWKGIDGTKLFTHFITTTNPYQRDDDIFATYNGYLEADSIHGAWKNYKNKDINTEVLSAYGWGDGGGGPSERMVEHGRRLVYNIDTLPKVEFANVLPFFQKLEERVHDTAPIWDGELYYEYHRGTYTSMARVKRQNQQSETILNEVEKLYARLWLKGIPYPHEEINRCWKYVLLNQFHDILPGSSIAEVYEQSDIEYAQLFATCHELLQKGYEQLVSSCTEEKHAIMVYNPLTFLRNNNIEVRLKEGEVLYDGKEQVPVQHLSDDRYMAFVRDIPPMGGKYLTRKCGMLPQLMNNDSFTLDVHGMHNEYYDITFDEHFLMTSIYDKEAKAELLATPRGNLLTVYEDRPRLYDNWDIDVYYKEKSWELLDYDSYEIKGGTLMKELHIYRTFLDSHITSIIRFYRNSRRIDFDMEIDWKQNSLLLKASFPYAIYTHSATFEIPYGNITRDTHENTSWQQAQFEVCGHRWVDISQYDHGIALLSRYKYGYEVKEGMLSISLLKSGTDPNPTTDQEFHYFTYALYPHLYDWKYSDVVKEAYQLHVPCRVLPIHETSNIAASMFTCNSDHVMLEVIKKCEDDDSLILRFYEYKNGAGSVNLKSIFVMKQVMECNALEEERAILPSSDHEVVLQFRPYEIKTIKIVWK